MLLDSILRITSNFSPSMTTFRWAFISILCFEYQIWKVSKNYHLHMKRIIIRWMILFINIFELNRFRCKIESLIWYWNKKAASYQFRLLKEKQIYCSGYVIRHSSCIYLVFTFLYLWENYYYLAVSLIWSCFQMFLLINWLKFINLVVFIQIRLGSELKKSKNHGNIFFFEWK